MFKPIPRLDVEVFSDSKEVEKRIRGFQRLAEWIRDIHPDGIHPMGVPWTEIFQSIRQEFYKPGVVEIHHRVLGPKNIHCIRKERTRSGWRWVLSYHWEGHCPGCKEGIHSIQPEGGRKLKRRRPVGGGRLLRRRPVGGGSKISDEK